MKKTIYIIIILGVIAIAVTVGMNNKQEGKTITVALDYTPNTNHTGLYVAQAKNYYKQKGLNVKIIQPSDGSTEQLVANGKADFGISYEENLLPAIDNGMDLKAIYAIQAHNTSGIISLKNKNITRPKDFEGKTYCGWGTDVEEKLVKGLMKADGGDPSKLKIMDTGGDIFTTKSNQCDLFWVYEGWDVVKANMEKLEYNYIPFTNFDIDWYTPIIITNNKNIVDNTQEVKDFVDATRKGYEYAIKEPDKSAEILLKAAPELDKEFILKSQEKVSTFYQADAPKLGYFDNEEYMLFGNYLQGEGVISTDINLKDTYTNMFN